MKRFVCDYPALLTSEKLGKLADLPVFGNKERGEGSSYLGNSEHCPAHSKYDTSVRISLSIDNLPLHFKV